MTTETKTAAEIADYCRTRMGMRVSVLAAAASDGTFRVDGYWNDPAELVAFIEDAGIATAVATTTRSYFMVEPRPVVTMRLTDEATKAAALMA